MNSKSIEARLIDTRRAAKRLATEHVRKAAELCSIIGITPRQFDRFKTRQNNPGKTAKGYPVAAWRTFIAAESDPSNELKRARYELLQLQIEKLRGDLVPSALFFASDEYRAAEIVRVIEQFRQTELGKCREPVAAKVIDERWDNFRTAVADAIESNRNEYIAACGRAVSVAVQTTAEADDSGVGEEVG